MGEKIQVFPGVMVDIGIWDRRDEFPENKPAEKIKQVGRNVAAMPRQAVAAAETGLSMGTNFLAHGLGAVKGLRETRGSTWGDILSGAPQPKPDWDKFGPAMSEHAEKYTYEPRIAPETAASQQQWMEDLYKKYKTDGWDEGVGKLVDKGIIGPEIATFLHTAPDAALMAFFMKGPKLVRGAIEGSANALAGGAFKRANPGLKPDAVRPATPRLTGPAAEPPSTTAFAEKVLPHDALAPGRAMTPTTAVAGFIICGQQFLHCQVRQIMYLCTNLVIRLLAWLMNIILPMLLTKFLYRNMSRMNQMLRHYSILVN